MGRQLQQAYGKRPQAILTMPLLEGLDGIKKMSKSLDNYIGITEPPEVMFGKLMSISDTLMWRYMELVAQRTQSDIHRLQAAVAEGLNPMELKLGLAHDTVARFHGHWQADAARGAFLERFRHRELPDDLPLIAAGAAGVDDRCSLARGRAGCQHFRSHAIDRTGRRTHRWGACDRFQAHGAGWR